MTGAPWAWALGATLLAQTAGAFLTRAIPVFAPVLAESAGAAPELVGQLAALNAFGTVCFLVVGGLLLARFGAVPLGGAIAGALIPFLVGALAWRAAVLVVAAVSALPVLVVWTMRAALEPAAERQAAPALRAASLAGLLWEPFRLMMLTPALRAVSLVGFALAAAQGALFGFLVTILVAVPGWSLESAGLCFAVTQVAGVLGRIGFGVVADRRGSGMGTLLDLGVASGLSLAAMTLVDASWPFVWVVALSAVLGFAMSGWNGVCLAEVARVAPAGQVGEATSSATLFIFLGYVVGPAAMTLLAARLEAQVALAAVGAAPLLAALSLLLPRSRPSVA